MKLPGGRHIPKHFARSDEVLLANKIFQASGAHALGERGCGWGHGEESLRKAAAGATYFSRMQRKAILALLMLCTLTAWADKRNKKSSPVPQNMVAGDSVDYTKEGAPMPAVRIVTGDGHIITEKDLRNDANLFVMLFNPTCEHCEDMTRALETSIGLFRESKIVLMSAPGMMPYLEYFDKNTNYTQFPSLITGVDSGGFIKRTFTYQMLPQINIYDKDRMLIRTFTGLTTVDSLKPYIQ
jgi:hypothetical protein